MADTLSSTTGAARILDAVQEALAAGRLPAGTRLREEALAAIFACGRGPVREALKALAELARDITAADIRRLREHLARQAATLAAGERREHLRLMGEFHRLLAALHGNAVLAEALDRLITRTSLMTALFPPDSQACAVDGHAALIDALARGDAEAARALASDHLRGNHARLKPRVPAGPVDVRAALLG
jgi:DNA-binding GntR family transcriptional regulator